MAEILETCWSCGGSGCYRCENGFRRVRVETIPKAQPRRFQLKKIALRFINKPKELRR